MPDEAEHILIATSPSKDIFAHYRRSIAVVCTGASCSDVRRRSVLVYQDFSFETFDLFISPGMIRSNRQMIGAHTDGNCQKGVWTRAVVRCRSTKWLEFRMG